MSSSHHHSFNRTDPQAREYFWGCTLSKDNPIANWSFTEEDDDTDFMDHTLFLRNATLGPSAVNNERNIVQVETTNYESKEIKQPLLSLTCGLKDSFFLDISFGGKTPVVFRLIEGSGPVHLSGQQLVEFPPEDEDVTQDETELLEDNEELDELDDSMVKDKKSFKRKAPPQSAKSKKKGKLEISAESDEESEEAEGEDEEDVDDDDDEDEEEEEDDDDDEDYGTTKGKKTSKPAKGKDKGVKKIAKKSEKVASKVVKKVVKKAKK
ncbi:nucleoplasmin-like protein ANO39 [Gigantopelta aegis]|uniref:nucleoplasmin-like protein ANO39 n=1 Tax=Gigantopelta aegis TaxID=1735272 RepID=UPI001B889267|nr:nucleoplasmin-like protein ANO39 [Gigantopelta aegis]